MQRFAGRTGVSFPGSASAGPLEMEDPGLSRITRAIVALVTILAVAGVGALGTLLVLRARDDAMKRAGTSVRERAQVVAQVVHDAIRDDLNAVRSTTTRPFFRAALVSKTFAQTHAYLSELIATHTRMVTVAVYDRTGHLVARIPLDPAIEGKRFSQQEYFVKARDLGYHVSSLFSQLGNPKAPVIAYSGRVFFGGASIGVLAATTPLTAFDSLVAPYSPSGWAIRVYDQLGQIVSPSSEASGRTFTGDAVVGPAFKGSSTLKRTGRSLVAAAPIADFGWAVAVSQPAKQADENTRTLTIRLSIFAGGAFLLALIAAALAWFRRAPATA